MASFQLTSTLAHEDEKLLACIHCGLCLEACPTYVITGDENDGPRGRLYLMRAVGEARLASDSLAFERHIDRCLGCRACEQVCPAGVEYGQLLEAARGELFTTGKTRGFSYGLLRLLLKHVWLHTARLKFAFGLARIFRDAGLARLLLKTRIARLFSSQFEFGLALLASSAQKSAKPGNKSSQKRRVKIASAAAAPRENTMLFTGCVGAGLFSRVNHATRRVLEANGFAVESPSQQVCCGALHAHAGDLEGARTLARRNIKAFSGTDQSPIITNAGGCGAMLATYGHLLGADVAFADQASQFSERVRDVSQQLETVGTLSSTGLPGLTEQPGRSPQPSGLTGVVTYDASCHLLYGQHAGEAPLKMVGSIPELNFTRLEGSERCCGGAGIYNLLEPELSRSVLEEKLRNIQETGAKILATGNPGCQMQIGAGAMLAGMDLTVCHPVELLDDSY
ncbi:MAG: heterodisulfide reductase-related iron-sulfur binding cluster, partial [bacterium]